MTFKQHSTRMQRAVNKRSNVLAISLNVALNYSDLVVVIFFAIHNSVNQRHCYWIYDKPPTPTSATRYGAYFGRAALVRQRAPAVPCCSARETPVTPNTTKTHLRRWSRGGTMAVASRDRKRRSAATRRQ